MDLSDLLHRTSPPHPWAEGDNIPWNEPGFSQRMLKEHLSQVHDAASRRFETIDRHVEWIHHTLLTDHPAVVLDLCCGPGLYTERLARLGHTCYGIDYSPASIEYATKLALRNELSCTYARCDIRQASFPHKVGLVMLIFGEFNVFTPDDAGLILNKAWESLTLGGWLLLEPHPYHILQQIGEKPPSWYSSSGGLFSGQPHIVLQENFWNEVLQATTIRYFVIDADTSRVTRFAQSYHAYRDEEYRSLLSACGFGDIQILSGLLGEASPTELIAITARKQNQLGRTH